MPKLLLVPDLPRPRHLPTLILAALVLAACGGESGTPESTPEAPGGTDARAAADAPTSADAGGPPLRQGSVASFAATVSGARDTTYAGSTEAGNVQPGGGCSGDDRLAISFTVGADDLTPTGRVRLVSSGVVSPGATGSIPLDTIAYWFPRMGLRSQGELTFVGPGTLQVSRHDAVSGARRMTATASGRGLTDAAGAAVDLEVSFDMGFSCGTSG